MTADAPDARIQRRFFAASVSFSAILGIALLVIGPTHTVLAPWDVVINMDEAWRIYSGQAPHQDFHTPVGAFCFYLTALGMHIAGPSFYAFAIGNALFMSLATGLAVFVSFRRLPPLEAFLFCAFVALLASGMCQIGRSPELAGYVEVHNRYGWTLACIFFAQTFFPERADAVERSIAEALVAALALSLIVYTKISFGVVCALALAVAVIMTPRWRSRQFLVALIGGGLFCIVAAWLLMRTSIFDYANDVAFAAEAQAWSIRYHGFLDTLRAMRPRVAVLAAVWIALIALPLARRTMPWREALRITVLGGLVGGCALAMSFANTAESGEIPLLVVIGMLLLNETRRKRDDAVREQKWAWLASAALVGLALATPIMWRDASSIAAAAASHEYRTRAMPDEQRFQSAAMRDFVIPHDTEWVTVYWRSAELPTRINDGLALIRRVGGERSTVLTLSFSNPFPFALGAPAPRGAPVWLDYDYNFNEEVFLPPERVFADAEFVAIPIINDGDAYRTGRATTEALRNIYGPFLEENYVEAGRSSHWILLRRKQRQSDTPSTER